MKKVKLLAFVLSAALVVSGTTMTIFAEEGAVESAEPAAAQAGEENSYASEHLEGASAVYISGETKEFDDTYFYGAGYATDEEITAQIPNQYGMCSVVLAVGQGTDVTLNNPVIVSEPESYANGVFASAMSKITINGGTIDTDNSSGHGIDTTYMGHVYVNDAVIHTRGETSGALASDFGGGFITGKNLELITEGSSSPGIFCAGTTIILLDDSTINTTKATGVVVAHDHSVVQLDNCEVNAVGTAVNGLQALPSPESSDGSRCFVFGGSLNSETGSVLGEGGGRTEMNLIGVECSSAADSAISVSRGILTVNLWDTELTGSITCEEGNSLTINLYECATLTGEVSGDGEVVINVYDGGTYNGSFESVEAGEGVSAPEKGTFDDYLLSDWAPGSMTWSGSRIQTYVDTYEPMILENSAASFVTEGASSIEYDVEAYDPSENGIDLSILAEKSAHGFTEEEVFGGAESRGGATSGGTGDSDSGESSGESQEAAGDSSEAAGDSEAGESDSSESAGESEEASAADSEQADAAQEDAQK